MNRLKERSKNMSDRIKYRWEKPIMEVNSPLWHHFGLEYQVPDDTDLEYPAFASWMIDISVAISQVEGGGWSCLDKKDYHENHSG